MKCCRRDYLRMIRPSMPNKIPAKLRTRGTAIIHRKINKAGIQKTIRVRSTRAQKQTLIVDKIRSSRDDLIR